MAQAGWALFVKNIAMAAAALMAASSLMCAPSAMADVAPAGSSYTFDFSGKCGDCTGYGTGVLQVQNYMLGSQFQNANLVDFSYMSDLTSFDINPQNDVLSTDTLTGSLNTAPGFYSVSVNSLFFGVSSTSQFTSSTDGTWSVSQNTFDLDHGTQGQWNGPAVSAAPEPSAWALMILGIGGIGFAFRQAKRNHSLRLKDCFAA